CIVAGASIGIINYYLLNVLLFVKLRRIAEVSTAISNHDLSFHCEIQSHDVIGEITNSANKMADTLRNVVSELKASGEQILNGVNQICVVADATSHGVQNQHNQTQNVEVAIQRMTQIAQDVSSKAAQAAQAAAIAKEESEKGNTVVGETIRSIQSLAGAVETAAESINRVEAESLNIGGVLDVIQGISEQTNLLALNAAIEAARAGEQGRGFAVVADEVRTLAQRTQESTKEIQSMIETLQTVSKDTVAIMKEGQIQANGSVKHATEAGDSLQQITQAVQAITEMNTLINDEAGSQSGVAVEINQNMHAISEIASESMNGAEKTNQESQRLADLANNLQQLVDKFKL
ncbi:Methyl-accepting chemotaxis sensor/transducer protein, partial [hydrothermal vent metagenome]